MTEQIFVNREEDFSHTGDRSIDAMTIPIAKDRHGILFTVRIDFRRSDIPLGSMVEAVMKVENEILRSIMEAMDDREEKD